LVTRGSICRLVILAVFVATLLAVSGCSKGQGIGYGSGRIFTYPHETGRPIPSGYQYRMVFNELSPGGSSFWVNQKGARVSIVDAEGEFLLDESFDFGRRAAIESSVTWSVPETLTVELREAGFVYEGHPSPYDSYNAELEKSGGRRLAIITYHLDPSSGKFVRVR
jgi:hypothetical protein